MADYGGAKGHAANTSRASFMTAWRVTRLAKGLGEHAAAWDALNESLFNNHPMLESRFVDCLLRHFGDGSEHLCVLTSNGVTQAMCLLKPGKLGIWSTFLPSQAQVGPALLPSPDHLTDLIHSLPGKAARLDILCNDPEFGDLSGGNVATATPQNHALTMNIRLDGSFESYWAARSKNLTKNMGCYERRPTTDHIECRLLCITDLDGIAPAVARYAALELKGWKAKLGTAIDIKNKQGSFYTELMCRFAATGSAMVFELWLGDQLAASRLVIASADMPIILKTTRDETFDKYAPGRQLLKDVIESLFASHPGKVIEFYTDANSDTLAWATGQRWIKHVSVYRSTFTENAFHLLSIGHRVLTLRRRQPDLIDDALSVSVYRHPDELPSDVKDLFDQSEQEGVELGLTWYRNLVNTVFADPEGVYIYVLRKNGAAMAALPLVAKRNATGQGVASLSNYYTSVYAPVMQPGLRARDLKHLIDAIKVAHAPLGTFRLAPMDPKSSSFCTLLEALQTGGLEPFKFFCFGNWYLRVNDSWYTYLKTRKGTLRNTIKRMTKKFAADGGTLELTVDGVGLERSLDAFERVYRAKWKKGEPYPEFIPGLARTCAERGWLRLGTAWFNGEPIAAQLWIVANGKANIYKVAYNEEFKSYAPATLVTAMLMEHVIEQDKVTEVDFLIGDDAYKKNWMSHRRERWGIIAYNPRTVGGVIGLIRETMGRILRPLIALIRAREFQKIK